MDLPVETIGCILDGRVSLEEVLSEQLLELKDKQFMIQGSIDLCQQIVSDQAYNHINLDYYLDYVKKEEANGRKFGNIDSFLEDFSEFTQVKKYARNSILGWYLCSHPRMNKIFTILWCALFVFYPVFGIVDDLVDENGLSPGMQVFWMMWIVFCGVSFVGFQRAKRKEGLS